MQTELCNFHTLVCIYNGFVSVFQGIKLLLLSGRKSLLLYKHRSNKETEVCVTIRMRQCTENDEQSESKTTSLSITRNTDPMHLNYSFKWGLAQWF